MQLNIVAAPASGRQNVLPEPGFLNQFSRRTTFGRRRLHVETEVRPKYFIPQTKMNRSDGHYAAATHLVRGETLNPAGEISANISHRIAELFIMLHDPFGGVLRLFR